ncbi:MAG: adenylate/guanylate cyclase domain-containing protein [Cyanobacteria bacterium P01_A01_bin.116]
MSHRHGLRQIGRSTVTPNMFLNKRQHYSSWIKQHYHQWFQQRRKGEQEATANRIGLWSGLVVAGLSVGFSAIGAWNILEQQSYNLLHHAQRELVGTPSWNDDIVVVAIDEASVQHFGRFPWSRDRYASLLDQLWVAQPAAIAFNIFFPEATDQDSRLAEAINRSSNVVLAVGTDSQGHKLGITNTIAAPAEGAFLPGDTSNPLDIDGVSRRAKLYSNQGTPSLGLATLQVYIENISRTAQASATASHSQSALPSAIPPAIPPATFANTAVPEIAVPEITFSNTAVPEIAVPKLKSPRAAFLRTVFSSTAFSNTAFSNTTPQNITRPNVTSAEALLERLIPKHDGPLWLNWPGEISSLTPTLAISPTSAFSHTDPPGALKVYSYLDVVEGRVDATLFQNKIVLVGSTLTGVDPLRTPFHQDPPVSGVFLYAAKINNLLDQSFLQRPPQWYGTLLLVILALVSSRLFKKQGVYRRLAVVVGFPVCWSALALGSFFLGWWLPVAAPIGTILLSAIAVQLHEQQEKQQLMALFSMNVSPGTAELIWRHKGEILDQGELAAQTLTATVLFMDIRGFTSIAESLPTQQLLPWLNQYFETMTDCIMNHGGMVDKYIGDAIMAVFGAPVPRTTPEEVKADAIAALNASLEMHERLKSLNRHLAQQGLPTIKFGVGIHTGPLIGGTVGNRHRLNYSLFGDTVNIAARLETMTKALPDNAPFRVLISADTYDYANADFPVQLFRSTRLRGRTAQTDIYTLMGKMEQPSRRKTDRVEPVAQLQSVPQTVDVTAKAS